jgi:hypothetical protein
MIFGETRDNAEHTLPEAIQCQSAPVLFNAFVPSPILARLNLLCRILLVKRLFNCDQAISFHILLRPREGFHFHGFRPISISNLEFGVNHQP